jgi:hypothetical protein
MRPCQAQSITRSRGPHPGCQPCGIGLTGWHTVRLHCKLIVPGGKSWNKSSLAGISPIEARYRINHRRCCPQIAVDRPCRPYKPNLYSFMTPAPGYTLLRPPLRPLRELASTTRHRLKCKSRHLIYRTVSGVIARDGRDSLSQRRAPPSNPAPTAPRFATSRLDRGAAPRTRHPCRQGLILSLTASAGLHHIPRCPSGQTQPFTAKQCVPYETILCA